MEPSEPALPRVRTRGAQGSNASRERHPHRIASASCSAIEGTRAERGQPLSARRHRRGSPHPLGRRTRAGSTISESSRATCSILVRRSRPDGGSLRRPRLDRGQHAGVGCSAYGLQLRGQEGIRRGDLPRREPSIRAPRHRPEPIKALAPRIPSSGTCLVRFVPGSPRRRGAARELPADRPEAHPGPP